MKINLLKRFLFLSFSSVALCSTFSTAQVQTWVARTDGGDDQMDDPRELYVDAVGNSYASGYVYTVAGGQDMGIAKYNSSGTLLWLTTWDAEPPWNGNIDWINAMAIDASGNVYVTGYTTNPDSSSFIVIKYNTNGVRQWKKYLGVVGSVQDEGMAITIDANYVYATGRVIATTFPPYHDYVTAKLDINTGAIQAGWPQRFNGTGNNEDIPRSIAVDGSGNVYVTGSSINGSGDKDYVTIVYNSSGNINAGWPVAYNGTQSTDDTPVQLLLSGSNIIVTGISNQGASPDTLGDITTIMYTSAGTVVPGWPQTYNGTGNRQDGSGNTNNYAVYKPMTLDASGNIYLTGWTTNTSGNYDIVTFKYSSAGVIQAGWPQIYDNSGNQSISRGLVLDDSNNVYITGFVGNFSTADNYLTMEYNNSGVLQSGWPVTYNGTANSQDDAEAIGVNGQCVWVTGFSTGTGTFEDFTTVQYCNSALFIPAASFQSASTVFCVNNCINFTDKSTNATSWKWSFPGGTPSSSTAENPQNICYNTSGPYSVKLVATNAYGSDSITLNNYITVNPLPTIGVSPSAPILCNGQSTLLTASGGTSYTWSQSTGLSATIGTTVTANPTSTTTYTVVGTDVNGCTNTKTETVTVNPLPSINVGPSAPIICNNQSVLLTASGGTTYIWSPSTGLSATTGTSVSANPSGNTTYTVTGTDGNGCTNTKTVTVTVNPLPVIGVNPTAPILCNGQSVSLTVSGGTTYVWSPSTGLSATSGATVSANPSSSTTYTITGTDGNGCTNTKSLTVTVNPLPVIGVSPTAPILCNGQSVSLIASGGNTYTWSPSSGLSATTGTTVSANPSSTSTYTITGTDGNGCTNTKSVTVTVNPLPVITVSPSAPILCNGQSVSLTAGGGNTYIWSPSAGLSATTGTIVSANPSSTATYIVTGTDGNGCTNTGSVTVTVNPLPLVSVNPSAPVLCNGQSTSLTASGGITYTWNPSTGLSSGSGSIVSANPTTTTTYTATGTNGNGCTNTSTATVTVNSKPTITINPTAPILCNGQSVLLTAGGGNTYTWSPSAGLSVTTGATVSANPSSTTDYTVTGTDANGCTNTKDVTVTVNPLPIIAVNPSAPSLCNGASVSLTADGGVTYVWSPGAGLSATTGSTVSANPSSTSTYIITGTDANGCTNTGSVTVTVNSTPTIIINPVTPVLCNGQSLSLTASGANTYIWSPGTGLSATTGATVSANPSSTTTYTVLGTEAGGCSSTKTVIVTVNPLPVVTASPSSPVLCNGQSVSLNAGGGNTYVWSPATGLSSGSGATVSANPSSTTTYIVTGTDGNSCTNTASVTVNINPLPTIIVSPSAPILCNGQSVSLTAGGGNTYVWNPTTGLSSGSGATVSANPSTTTLYTVIGTDGNGCTNTGTTTVTVNPLPDIIASPTSTVLCNGQSVTLTAGGGNAYVWSPATGLSSGSGSTISANPNATTSYTVTGTDGNGCTNTASVTVTINPTPTITANPASPILCNGQFVSLNAGGGNTYVWSPTTGLSSGGGSTVSANPSATSTYIVTGTDRNGCTNTATVTVTVNPKPLVTVNPLAPVLCNGQSVSLTAGGANNYVWSPTTGLSSGSGDVVSANPSSTATYEVTGTDGNGCTNTASVTVTVNPLPVVAINPIAPVLCNGQSVSLTASGGSTYSWVPTTGLSSGSGTIVSANPSSTTSYTVTGTDGNGCSNTASIAVTVNPLPVVNAGPDVNICPNDSSQLNVTGPPPGSTYIWTPATNLSCSNCADPYAFPHSSTTYIVSATTPEGCSAQDTVNVIVTPLAPVAGPDTSICSGVSVQLHASGGTNYLWIPSATLSDSSIANPVGTPLTTTTYTVTVSSGSCSATSTVSITVFASPPTPNIIQSNDTLKCSFNPVYTAYQWYFNTDIIPNATNAFYVASQSGNYNVVVFDENGCSISVGINIILNVGIDAFSFSNAISLFPNPATNQLFISGYGFAQNATINVYNMLGEKVLEELIKEDNQTSIDIENISSGVYFIEVKSVNNQTSSRSQALSKWIGKFVKE